MGAPTGSSEVEMVTRPEDTRSFASLPAYPRIAILAGDFTLSRLIFAHTAGSGLHIRVLACSALKSMPGPAVGSILPACMNSPGVSKRIPADGSAKETSITHRFAD